MIFLKKINFLFFFLLTFLACNRNSNGLNKLFQELEEKIEHKLILNDIKTYSADSLVSMLTIFSIECDALIYESNYEYELCELLELESSDLYSSFKDEILLFAFQKYLNHQKINIRTLREKLKDNKALYEKERILEKKKEREKLLSILRINNEKWEIGDTLSNIVLPVYGDKEYYTIYYKRYPATLDYSFADDTLKMKGILVKKFYDKDYSGYEDIEPMNPLSLFFKIEILNLSHDKIYHLENELKEGDEFILPLKAYGRLID